MRKLLRTLIRRSFAANRLRNMIAVLAIALTAVLFTSITTIGVGAMQSTALTLQIQKMSMADGDFRYMTEEQFETVRQADFVREAGLRMPVGYLNNSRHNIELNVEDEIQARLTFCMPSHGKTPQAANELVTSDRALQDLGVEPEVGAEVTIEFTAHGREYRLPMVVSGWYEALNDQVSILWVSTAFRDANPHIFQNTFQQDGEIAGTYFSDFTAADPVISPLALKEKMFRLVRSHGGDPEDILASNYWGAYVNDVTNSMPDPGLLAMVFTFIILFIFCGYLLIYNVFDIAVMQEIRRYGLYRTIGMSRKQVKGLINHQAIWLSCIGIPLGLLIGFFIGKATLPMVMNFISSSYTNIIINVSPSPVIFTGAAMLTALTVFLSTRKPVRAASDIPPVEAYHYVERACGNRSSRRSDPGADLRRLAWSNLGRSRRRTFFIMVSLMLCIILLNCTGTAADSIDIEKQVAMMTRTDFSVVNAASANVTKGFIFRSQGLSEQTLADISAQPGIYGEALIYKNTVEDTNVTYEFDHTWTDTFFNQNDSGLRFRSNENGTNFGLGDDGRPICNVYGMDENAIGRMDLREGETDAHILYTKMVNGEGVLVGVSLQRSDMSLNDSLDFVDVGEVITVYREGVPVLDLPVLAKAALIPDDEEIGYTSSGPIEVGGDGLFLYLPSDVYRELYDEPVIYKYSFNVEEDKWTEMTAFLENYIRNENTDIAYLSAETARRNAEGIQVTVRFVGGLVGVIFGISGVLNLINTIITTILTRRQEFATMQSIGMTDRQLRKMMMLEGIYYASGACVMGLALSVLLNLTLVRNILASPSLWFCSFHFTLLPALAACAVLLIVSAIIPVAALKLFNKGSIVEQLRKE